MELKPTTSPAPAGRGPSPSEGAEGVSDRLPAAWRDLAAQLPGLSRPADWPAALALTVTALDAGGEHFDWTGVYLVAGGDLVLGPFVGAPTEHVRIPMGQGICGAAAARRQTIVVDDVRDDERYLACFASTRSEVVVPIYRGGEAGAEVIGEIDVDSNAQSAFSGRDTAFLEHVAGLLGAIAPRDYLAGVDVETTEPVA